MQGTVEFMAPELVSCKSASTGSDMWSVGVVAYMLLSGQQSLRYIMQCSVQCTGWGNYWMSGHNFW
mgnify:CR=1 FL=1